MWRCNYHLINANWIDVLGHAFTLKFTHIGYMDYGMFGWTCGMVLVHLEFFRTKTRGQHVHNLNYDTDMRWSRMFVLELRSSLFNEPLWTAMKPVIVQNNNSKTTNEGFVWYRFFFFFFFFLLDLGRFNFVFMWLKKRKASPLTSSFKFRWLWICIKFALYLLKLVWIQLKWRFHFGQLSNRES